MFAFIAAAAAETTRSSAKAAEHSGGGLPQINAHDFAPQLVWLALTFLALYWLLSKIAIPRVGKVLQQRADRIAGDLDAANRLKTETETAIAAYEQALLEARGRAQKIVAENRDRLNADIARERTAVETQLQAKTTEAEARIEAAKRSSMGQVSTIASDTARAIVQQLIGHEVSVDEAVRALKS